MEKDFGMWRLLALLHLSQSYGGALLLLLLQIIWDEKITDFNMLFLF